MVFIGRAQASVLEARGWNPSTTKSNQTDKAPPHVGKTFKLGSVALPQAMDK